MLLHLVDCHRRQCGVVTLSGPNADDAVERLDEDLPVADHASACGADDRIYGCLDERLRAGHLDLDLFVKLQEELRPPPHRHSVFLPTVTAGATNSVSRVAPT